MEQSKANTKIHPSAIVETTKIGKGTRIWEFVHILPGATIGENCNICGYSYIENEVIIGNNVTVKNGVSIWDKIKIGNDVFIGPNAVFTNDPNPRAAIKKGNDLLIPTQINDGATIGANATVLCGIELGNHSFVGAGAVVTRDVPDYGLIVGNPGKLIGYMCLCGNKLHPGLKCSCGIKYAKDASGNLRIE